MTSIQRKQFPEFRFLYFQNLYRKTAFFFSSAIVCPNPIEILKADEVCSIIRDTNIASQKVAQRNGMEKVATFVKHYRGVDMPHFVYKKK